MLIDLLDKNGLQRQLLERQVIKWSTEHREDLASYISPSGEIKKGKIKSQGFKNYFEAAFKFNLINEPYGLVIPTKIGIVFKVLKKLVERREEVANVYELETLEKIFYLYLILIYDADIFLLILQMLAEKPKKPLEFYIDRFQEYYNRRLKDKIHFVGPTEKTRVMEALNRIAQWRTPERYCEDIVPPRLNWLLDLGLISRDLYRTRKNFELNPLGEKLYEGFPFVNDHADTIDINDTWTNHSLFSLLRSYFVDIKIKNWHTLSEDEQEKLMTETLFYAKKYFSPLDIPRLSVQQTYLFISLYLLAQRQTLVEFDEISHWIGFDRIVNTQRIGLRTAVRPEESYIVFSNAS